MASPTTDPRASAVALAAPPLRIAGIHAVVAERRLAYSPHDHDYYRDLLATFARPLDEDAFAEGRATFTELVAALLPHLGESVDGYDVAVMASAGPDAEPGWPMCYLQTRACNPGLAFAVGDQGLVSAYTALHLVQQWQVPPGVERALLFVVDQASNLSRDELPAHRACQVDQGVALVLAAGRGRGGTTLQAHLPVACGPDEVAALLDARTAELLDRVRPAGGAGAEVALVRGLGLRTTGVVPELVHEVVDTRPGAPSSGPWVALRELLHRRSSGPALVLVADYDPELGVLGACGVAVPDPGTTSGGAP